MTTPPHQLDELALALLHEASRVLSEEGPHALTVRKIADAAGTSTMGVYSRFGSKNGVVEALYREGFSRLQSAMSAVGATGDTIDDLQRLGRAYRQNAFDNPAHYAVMFGGVVRDFEPSDAARAQAGEVFVLLVKAVQRAIDCGDLRPVDAANAAYALWAMMHGLVGLETCGASPPIESDFEERFSVACDAVVQGFASSPVHSAARR